ncbi:MAG: undecaprenyl-diphosphatase UppP [Patescibacteria group bacterium]
MTYFEGLVLGLVQGVTEFLPISSSGHLIIVRKFFNFSENYGLAIDAVLQLATVIAIGIYFRNELWQIIKSFFTFLSGGVVDEKNKILLWAIILGTIPAVIAGLLLESDMEGIFRDVRLVVVTLVLGSILFVVAEKFAKQNENLTVKKGVWIGFFQCLALIPGISRSGATISGGLLLGLKREEAARFSFILAFPIIFGSGLLKFFELSELNLLQVFGLPLLFSSVTAFVSGYFAIHFLIKFLKNHSLYIFVWYRLALAAFLLIYFLN